MAEDVVIIGGGIVGLATALAVTERYPGRSVTLVEKESTLSAHQTGHNSGVIHSGVYYKPGSFKARFCRDGNRALVEFCRQHQIAHEVCGKLIVATEPEEISRLDTLYDRALAHGLSVERLGPDGIRSHEPHVVGLQGLWLASTGIVDYSAVAAKYAELVAQAGGSLQLNWKVDQIITHGEGHTLISGDRRIDGRFLISCAGLQSDRVARDSGADPGAQIVPFRGEYYQLVPHRRSLINGLVYPVPDPDFPFLGVHFTRMIDGSVHAGPNAVLALKREGYRKRDINLRDTAEVLRYEGFRHLARRHFRSGMAEVARSFSKRLFLRSLQRLVPEVTLDDLEPCHAGVRAQALMPDGSLVDDFLVIQSSHSIHVCNAPSPAATASLEIGRHVASQMELAS